MNAGIVSLQLRCDLALRSEQKPIVNIELCGNSELVGDPPLLTTLFRSCQNPTVKANPFGSGEGLGEGVFGGDGEIPAGAEPFELDLTR